MAEILDPGPVGHGGVSFIHVRHPDTGGEADVAPDTVAHWVSRGWETYEAPAPGEVAEYAEEASLSMRRDDLNDLALAAGVFDPEALPTKQAVIDAITERTPDPDPSPDGNQSEED